MIDTPNADARSLFGDTFRAMRNRNYRLYFIGQSISLSGTWMQTIAQALLVLQITDSKLALGTVTLLQFLPITIFVLFAGPSRLLPCSSPAAAATRTRRPFRLYLARLRTWWGSSCRPKPDPQLPRWKKRRSSWSKSTETCERCGSPEIAPRG